MRYLESVIGGILGAILILAVSLLIPFVALLVFVAGLLGQVTFSSSDKSKYSIVD